MENIFLPILRGKTVIVGIGNPLRGDDGFGPALIKELEGKNDFICIDAGSAPENYVGRIIKANPETILLVDAVHLDLPPGQYRILQAADILKCGFTTHDMSSRMLIEYLKNQTNADICLLGVQPQQVSLGEPMSEWVTETLNEVKMLLEEAGACTRPI